MDEQKDSYNQIRLADERGQVAVVVELSKKYLRKYPQDGFVWLFYAMALRSLTRYRETESAIRNAIKKCPMPALVHAYAEMGNLFRDKGDCKRAMFWYHKAIKEKPQDATYHIFLANTAFKYGRLKQAETHFRLALKCDKGCLDEALFNLGGILLGKRNYSEAIKCYQEALKIDPKYKIAKERLDDAELALFLKNS